MNRTIKLIILFFLFLLLNFSAFSKSRINISDIVKKYEESKSPEYKARLLISQNKYKSAYKILLDMIKKDKDNPVYYTMIGFCLEKMGHEDKAEIAYKKAISLNPKSFDSYNNLAYLYIKSNKSLEKALKYAEKAYKIKPNSPSIMDTYGFALFKNGDIINALKIYQEILPNFPGDAMIYYHLGLVLNAAGEKEEAKKALKNAITLDPSLTPAMKELEKLHSEKIIKKPETNKSQKKILLDGKNDSHSTKDFIWRADSFKKEYEKGLAYFSKLEYEKAENTWKMAIFWFEENGEISEYIYKAINYLGLIKQSQKDFTTAKYYYELSEQMQACYGAYIVKNLYDSGDYEKAYEKLISLSQKIPESLRNMLDHKEKVLNLKIYARKHGEEISFVKQDNFKEYAYYSFRDITGNPNCEIMLRYARSRDFKGALSVAEKIKLSMNKNPNFIIDYAQLLALNNKIEKSLKLLDSYSCNFFKQNWKLYLLLKAQLFLF